MTTSSGPRFSSPLPPLSLLTPPPPIPPPIPPPPSSSSQPPPTETPTMLTTDLQHITNTLTDRLERQLLHIKDRSFHRLHRKIDAILNRVPAKEHFETEMGRELRAVKEDVAGFRRELVVVKSLMTNQWVRRLSGSIVWVPPCGSGSGGDDDDDDDDDDGVEDVEDIFPATLTCGGDGDGVVDWIGDALVRLVECYALHINRWQDWGRFELDDPGAAQFDTLRDAVSKYPMRCLRDLAAVWGLAFDLLERPPDLVIVEACEVDREKK
ncbi:hypothetical protein ACJ72_07845 [Emergomyces africanus]|uniref:Uncharacterized protein n=1 Tax=Emergomyces africanus TaxID=1955775 RepID=A0A1B7NMN3_9EURO|nr:hypothetical protein ACJ72_07845 [Emergomyces africanus]